jgi:hypothetical protein
VRGELLVRRSRRGRGVAGRRRRGRWVGHRPPEEEAESGIFVLAGGIGIGIGIAAGCGLVIAVGFCGRNG